MLHKEHVGVQGLGAVSYTHLDVYKRQVLKHVEFKWLLLTSIGSAPTAPYSWWFQTTTLLRLTRVEIAIGLLDDLEKPVRDQSRRDRAKQPVTVFLAFQRAERSDDTGRICGVVAERGID